MFGVGLPELVILLVIVLLLFGTNKIGELGSGLGKAVRGFKDAVSGKDEIDITPKKTDESKKS